MTYVTSRDNIEYFRRHGWVTPPHWDAPSDGEVFCDLDADEIEFLQSQGLWCRPYSWDDRQRLIYGSSQCRCGSGLSPEECCG